VENSSAGKLWVVRLDGPSPRVALEGPAGYHAAAVAFRADGKQLALGHADGSVSIYDLETCRRVRRLELGVEPSALAFHPRDGRLAAVCGLLVRLFDVDTGRELPALRHSQQVKWISHLAWHPHGRLLATAGGDTKIRIWDARDARQITQPWEGHLDVGIELAFNHAGDRLASVDWGGQARLWNVAAGQLLLTIPKGLVVQFSADDKFLGYEVDGNKIRLWRLDPGRELVMLRRRQAGEGELIINPVAHPDGRLLIASVQSASEQNWLCAFDIEKGEELAAVQLAKGPAPPALGRTFVASQGWLTAGAAGPWLWPARPDPARADGILIGPPRRLVSYASHPNVGASRDGRILALPHPRGALVVDQANPGQRLYLEPQYDVRSCAVSPDGRWVATGSHWWDGRSSTARIWDAQSGRHVRDLPLNYSAIPDFSSDGRWLATTAYGGVKLWQVGTWEQKAVLGYGVFAFSPDGRLLAVNDVVEAIRLVDPNTGREVARLIGPESAYKAVAMTADGTRLIATGLGHKTLYVWDLRQLRHHLKEMGLDWDWPEFPAASAGEKLTGADAIRLSSTPHVRLDAGSLAPPAIADARHAVGIYSLSLALFPWHADAYLERGRAYCRLKDYGAARADLEMVLTLKPELASSLLAVLCNDVAWHLATGTAAETRAAQALPLAQKAVRLDPDRSIYRNTLGVVWYRLGRYQEAIACLEKTSKVNGDFNAFDGYFLAMSYQRLGRPETARDWFERSVTWSKSNRQLAAAQLAELAAFRAEAAAVLGIEAQAGLP
jgi:WD40 repeat protein